MTFEFDYLLKSYVGYLALKEELEANTKTITDLETKVTDLKRGVISLKETIEVQNKWCWQR